MAAYTMTTKNRAPSQENKIGQNKIKGSKNHESNAAILYTYI